MFTPVLCPRCTAIVIARCECGVVSLHCGGCGYGTPVAALIDMDDQRTRRRPSGKTGERPAA